jgi:hypothetical protein
MEAQMYIGFSLEQMKDCLEKYGVDGYTLPEGFFAS